MFRSFCSIATFLVALGLSCSISLETQAQDNSAKTKRPAVEAVMGTVKIDGQVEDDWKNAPEVEIKKIVKSETNLPDAQVANGKAKFMWDREFLYALIVVKDSKLSTSASDDWAQDSVELFLDELNERAGSYQKDDVQYRVSCDGKISGAGPEYKSENIKAVAKKNDGGYLVEVSLKLSYGKLQPGTMMGLELQINDDPGTGNRGGVTKFNHPENDSYLSTSDFGSLVLKEKSDAAPPLVK